MEEQKEEKKQLRISLGTAILLFIIILLSVAIVAMTVYFKSEKPNTIESKVNNTEITDTKKAFKYALKGNSLEDFDLRFLQLENERKNKIYSPLSIKYALAMLNEGTEGESKEQILNLIGDYKPNKYVNSANMSLANALFIRDTYKNSVKEKFVNNLKTKYNADVEYDSFTSAKKMNSWISNKTLKLIDNMLDDSSVNEVDFALVNAVAIDMEWKNKFLENNYTATDYRHEKYSWMAPKDLLSSDFEGVKNKISGMGIIASVNNYDIVNTLGEDNIRKTVGDAFRKYLNEGDYASYYLEGKNIETAVKEYLDSYMEEIEKNYKSVDKNTDFYVYQDEKVKSFAKDLKEYNGTTLQYVAIMPEENLDKYISNITAEEINKIIGNLKDINKRENFKEGVITQVVGYIPKFKFDYDLNLIKDLNDMGVKDIFDENKANLKGITDEKAYINQAKHKANIEFTQDGIKAAAATFIGGAGAGEMFDYLYDVPVEKIDLTFDKPYMFVIRNKETGEVWFAGTVYEPLSLEDEAETKNEEGEVRDYSQFLKELEERNKQ
jgi:serpin E3